MRRNASRTSDSAVSLCVRRQFVRSGAPHVVCRQRFHAAGGAPQPHSLR
jgi:hypothetical protein